MLDKAVAERIVHDYKVEAIIYDSKCFRNIHFVDLKELFFTSIVLQLCYFAWVWHSN